MINTNMIKLLKYFKANPVFLEKTKYGDLELIFHPRINEDYNKITINIMQNLNLYCGFNMYPSFLKEVALTDYNKLLDKIKVKYIPLIKKRVNKLPEYEFKVDKFTPSLTINVPSFLIEVNIKQKT